VKVTFILFMIGILVFQERVEAQSRGRRSGGGSGVSSNRPSPHRGGGYNPGRSSTPAPRHSPHSGNTRPRVATPHRSSPPHVGHNPSRTPQVPRHYPSPGNNHPRVDHSYRPNPPRSGYNPTPNRGPVVTRPGGSSHYNPRSPSHHRGQGSRYSNRPMRTHYGSNNYHRPYGHTQIRYTHYYHAPYRYSYGHTARYYRSHDWYNFVFRTNSNYIYAHWIFYPASGYNNGYWTIDNYPYYVYNGYRNRYSTNDQCNYQMVDQHDHTVVQTYWNQFCNVGYDSCSLERDRLNSQMNDYRYFCSETYRDHDYDYSTPSYDEGNYGHSGYDN
jgi:hypothetical protein